MCEYCSKPASWIFYTNNKTFNIMTCDDDEHIGLAVKKMHDRGNSSAIVHSEKVDN